jgi:mevalonate kinase
MKWTMPAKTFLLGEYVALMGGPAIVLTTSPYFELSLLNRPGLGDIHPESPAGKWWAQCGYTEQFGLHWFDPYHHCGGLGASSAQFVGAYRAHLHIQNQSFDAQAMLEAYRQCAWQGEGLRPSGYDVLAQSLDGCVYIHAQKGGCQKYPWPFEDIAFILLHTGQKLATHHHLQSLALSTQTTTLGVIVENAKAAFETVNSLALINAVNGYYQALEQMGLVAEHSLKHLQLLREHPDILAAKGCGAMGADILLLLVMKKKQLDMQAYLSNMGWNIVGMS